MSDPNTSLEVCFYDTVDEIDLISLGIEIDDIFWKKNFHKLIENLIDLGCDPYYAVLLKNKQPIGFYYFQLKKFRLQDSLKVEGSNFYSTIKKASLSLVNFNCLVCGNLLITGSYGFKMLNIIDQTSFDMLKYVIDKSISHIKNSKYKNVNAVLVKDFYLEEVKGLHLRSYAKLQIQPNMVFNINNQWHSIDDYCKNLKTKYKKRLRTARRKSSGLIGKILSYEQVVNQEKQIFKLYQNVSQNARFNLFTLDLCYFSKLKKTMGDDLIIKAYYKNDILCGFLTAIKNYNQLDAHFLGYDFPINKTHQLYLNMLYDMVEIGIGEKLSKIVMSRTALEIKSSIGAKPKEMICYFKHCNKVINLFTPRLLSLYKPNQDWVPRNPYKTKAAKS